MPAFLGEIQLFSGSYPPKGWAACAGQTLAIFSNQPLFGLLGTTFGGNGTTNFNLPDLRGRVPIGVGDLPVGAQVGAETVTLSVTEMPGHSHRLRGTSNPGNGLPGGQTPAAGGPYATTNDKTLMPAVAEAGGSQPHPNVAPSTVLLWCIALQGPYPEGSA